MRAQVKRELEGLLVRGFDAELALHEKNLQALWDRAYEYLERSAYVDIRNNQRNTREGIHAASAGGTWQCVTLGYCGMEVAPDGVLSFSPHLPARWSKVEYGIEREGTLHRVTVTGTDARIVSDSAPIRYRVNGETRVSEVGA